MAVTWVGGGPAVFAAFGSSTVSGAAPAGIADGDVLLACVFGRGTITPPSGWTKLREVEFSNPAFIQYVVLFSKDTVTTADASATFTFDDDSFSRCGLLYAVARGVDGEVIGDAAANSVDSWSITPASATAGADGSMLLVFVSQIYPGDVATPTPTPQASFTLFSGAALADYRLAGAYRSVDTGQSNSGAFNMDPAGANPIAAGYAYTNGLGAITVLLSPAGGGIAPVDGIAAAPGPLGAAASLALASVYVRSAAPGPLGAPLVMARQSAALLSVPSMLGQAAALAAHDFTSSFEGQPLRYVMDLIFPPAGAERVPISSWQATLQLDRAQYVQCVVPACEPYVDQINAAPTFRIRRRALLPDGQPFEYDMAVAPLQTVQMARGSRNYTATLSGYAPPAEADEDPPEATARTLRDVRSVTTQASGIRVSCAIDWLLRPGQIAYVDGVPFVASYINYYCSDGDQYMDVGERTEAG